MKQSYSILLGIICTAAACNAQQSPLSIDDTVRLDNGHVRLVVSPKHGRVIEFGYVAGPNVLWTATKEQAAAWAANQQWVNWGGDKIWPLPQSQWKTVYSKEWPPAIEFDQSGWTVEKHTKHVLVMRSPLLKQLGIVITRKFTLSKDASEVTISNIVRRMLSNSVPIHIWAITQVRPPKSCIMGFSFSNGQSPKYIDLSGHKYSYEPFVEYYPNALHFRVLGAPQASKIGTFGSFIAAVYDENIFLQQTDFRYGCVYYDKSNLHFYVNPPPHLGAYAEIETLSPYVELPVGETLTNTVYWSLIRRKSNKSSLASIHESLRQGPTTTADSH